MSIEEVWDNLLANYNRKLASKARIRAACEKPSNLVLSRRSDKIWHKEEKMRQAHDRPAS